MVLSPYVKTWPHPDKPGTLLVLGTRKASMCLLPEALFRRLEAGEVPPEAEDTLTRLGLLTADAETEREEALGTLGLLNRVNTGLSTSVFLGMDCNFRCPYCYEGSLKGRHDMTAETARRVVDFIASRFPEGMTDCIVDFYGGEPLLYPERIEEIAVPLRRLVEERGAKWIFTLVTNGSLLTRATATRLKALGLRAAKVTLDGPRDLHDQTRPYRTGRGSFDAIVRNLQECTDVVTVGLGGNYTRDNYRRFPELLDYLLGVGLGPDRIAQVAFGPVLQTTDAYAPEGFCGGCASMDEEWIREASVFLRREVLRRGYRVPKVEPTPCMIDIEGTLVINWDGTLTKCPGVVGNERFVVGNVVDGFTDYRESLALDRLEKAPECRTCEYLPLCFGGCRYLRYEREGTVEGVECQRAYLDATLGDILLADMGYRR